MRLLIDINVLLDVALQRPGAAASARLLALCGRQHEGWLAWHSLATLAYLIERQQSAISVPPGRPRAPSAPSRASERSARGAGLVSARDFIRSMLVWADVAKTGRPDALAALELPMRDFEDALQVAAAMACGAQFIVTRNERDFKTSPVPALNPEAFLRQYPDASQPVGS